MGKVLAAVHEETGVEVAIKVLLKAQSDEEQAKFQREIQAQAGLVHPRITGLLDAGVIDGAPYVVMERALGTVGERLPLKSWVTVREVLLQALDGLAHAHARDVVHRDIKPANLLLFADGLKLADFGIAHRRQAVHGSEEVQSGNVTGTANYMAPEQIRNQWRYFGPWTDVYALGCVAYQLVCGTTPYGDRGGAMRVLLAHLDEGMPEIEPKMAVPEGLAEWIHSAMAPDWRRRFQSAAEAAQALVCLGEAREDGLAKPAGVEPERDRIANTELLTVVHGDDELLWIRRVREEQGAGSADSRRGEPVISVPETWRHGDQERWPPVLSGTGLGLFGQREIPFVGREAERDSIWERLQTVLDSRRAEVLLVQGEAGTGKSRLVDWIGTRARELGLVQVMRMRHSPVGGRLDEGFAGLLRQVLQVGEAGRGEIIELLNERGIEGEDTRALAEIASPSEREGEGYRFTHSGEPRIVVRRWLVAEARELPLVLWIEDAQWSEEARVLAQELRGMEIPILVILTVRSEELGEDERRELELAEGITLEPLGEATHRRVIDRMLPLAPEVAEEVASRSEGNPLFAMQIVTDWADQRLTALEAPALVEMVEDLDCTTLVHQIVDELRRKADPVAEALAARVARLEPPRHSESLEP